MGDNLGPAKEKAQAEVQATIKKRAEEAKDGMDAKVERPVIENRQDR